MTRLDPLLSPVCWADRIGVPPIPISPMRSKQPSPIYDESFRQAAVNRLNRAEGQIRGIARMLEEERPCVQVLEQLASVQAALRGVTKTVLRNYLERCATDAIRSGDAAVYDQLMEVIYKFAK